MPTLDRWLNEPAVGRGWGAAAAVSLAEFRRPVEGWLTDEAVLRRPVALVDQTLDGEAGRLAVLCPDRREGDSVDLFLQTGDPARSGSGLGSDALRIALEASFAGWNRHRDRPRREASNAWGCRPYARRAFRREGVRCQAAFLDGHDNALLGVGQEADDWAASVDA